MSQSPSSTIRVFVRFKQPAVFAGEDVECTIIFKNIASVQSDSRNTSQNLGLNGFLPEEKQGQQIPKPSLAANRSASHKSSSLRPYGSQQALRGHRSTLSLNLSSSPNPQSSSLGGEAGQDIPRRQRHGRSVSIISIGSERSVAEGRVQGSPPIPRRHNHGHGRSASLQVVPRGLRRRSPSSPSAGNQSNQPSPLAEDAKQSSIADSEANVSTPSRPTRPRPRETNTAPSVPTFSGVRSESPKQPPQDFKFPAAPSPEERVKPAEIHPKSAPTASHSVSRSPRPPDGSLDMQAAKFVPSEANVDGTPRSSIEFYSMNNHSNETLASEYAPQASKRLLPAPAHVRRASQIASTNHQRTPEILMMGYAQVTGSFTVDGSLVNQAPFEEVQRKGGIGRGFGGVVGIEKSTRDTGLFGALGWSRIGDSLGGLLGGGESNSIREMRAMASSRSITLLSTPQSILFVDLHLAPGESRSFGYSFTLPRGLPPSHKGRAMKVTYNLIIGTQRPGSTSEKQVRHVEIPFRVLGGVNSKGETLGHDLMSPYIILRDEARTLPIPNGLSSNPGPSLKPFRSSSPVAKEATSPLDDFLAYTNQLLEHAQDGSSGSQLSPTDDRTRRRSSFLPEPATAKEAIDFAILRSNQSRGPAGKAANRFEVSRAGLRVAVLSLPRCAYRLSETVQLVVDFSFPSSSKPSPSSGSSSSPSPPLQPNTSDSKASVPPDLHTYAITATLEFHEVVDQALALRSPASIERATRRIYATMSEKVMWARRAVFSAAIPSTGTPEFLTSCISGEWAIRVEFVVLKQGVIGEQGGGGNVEEASQRDQRLLQLLQSDERGTLLGAVERVRVESFEVAIPIRVYGAAVGGYDGADGEGLVV